jgi:hypothetical protein
VIRVAVAVITLVSGDPLTQKITLVSATIPVLLQHTVLLLK